MCKHSTSQAVGIYMIFFILFELMQTNNLFLDSGDSPPKRKLFIKNIQEDEFVRINLFKKIINKTKI